MHDTEHAHQVTVVNWFRNKYPKFIIFAIPNGELRTKSVASRLKHEGVLSGIPDLCCIFDNGITLWVEMKKEKGGIVSPNQKEIHGCFNELGHKIVVCKGYQKAIEEIDLFYKYIKK